MIYLHTPFSPITFIAEIVIAAVICYTFYKVLIMTVAKTTPPKSAKLLSFKKVKFNGKNFELK